jgi:hypothetical protein
MKFAVVFATTFVLAAAGLASTAMAQTPTGPTRCPAEIAINVGRTETVMKVTKQNFTIIISDPEIADVKPGGSSDVITLQGRKRGNTNFLVYEEDTLICRTAIKVGPRVRDIKGGKVNTYFCDAECVGSKEPTLSELPPGSSVSMPVGRR